MTNVGFVRADSGRLAEHFARGRYVGIGGSELGDLSDVGSREPLYDRVRATYPELQSPIVIGNHVGQITHFLHWDDIPLEFRERLGLKPGLVRA